MSISTKFDRVRSWRGRKAGLACFLSGALMALAFAPFGLWPVIFLSLPVFYLQLAAAENGRSAALRGFFFGYGYFMMGTWWIANAMLVDVAKFGWMIPLSILGLSAVFAIWFAAFGYVKFRLKSPVLAIDLLRFSVLWVLMEYARSYGMFGFPWNLAGYIALNSIAVAQLASVIGTFGLSFFVVRVGLAPLLLHEDQPRRIRRATVIAPLLLVSAVGLWGHARMPEQPLLTRTQLRLVQPSVPQSLKADPRAEWEVMNLLSALSRAPAATPVHAVLWPETALPFTLWPDGTMPKQTMESIRLKAPLITGVVAAERDKQSLRLWNSIAAIDPEGQVVARYAKHQLVPFGEFVPLRSILPLEKITPGDIDFSRGAGPQTVTVPGLPPFSPLVCYEVIFPWIAVDPAHRPEWMLNVTNDGWYGDSPGPYQHFAMARMRAIEQGLPLVRVANNGISAVVDPYGRMGARLALNRRAALDSALPAPLPPTLYARYGEWPALLLLTVALTLGFLPLWLFSVGKGK